jgi:phosphoribosylamine-glycine ligase
LYWGSANVHVLLAEVTRVLEDVATAEAARVMAVLATDTSA